jgi:hypothetical protein
MLLRIINTLPNKLQFYIIVLLLHYATFVVEIKFFIRDFWLKYYVKMLVRTKNYYFTLAALNENMFCPEDLNVLFIEEVKQKYSDIFQFI